MKESKNVCVTEIERWRDEGEREEERERNSEKEKKKRDRESGIKNEGGGE